MTTSRESDGRLYQAVGEALMHRVLDGQFNATGKLPSERELATLFDVGRATIRDALVMLEVKGLVEVRQGSGIYISRRAYEAQALALSDLPDSRIDEIVPPAAPFELLQARQFLESHIARLAATNATDLDLRDIRQAYEDHRNAPFGEAKEGLDLRFHLTIARATQNLELVEVIKRLRHRRDDNPLWLRVSERIRDTQYRDRWVLDHANLLDAITQRDGEAAYVAMWQHLENVKRYLKTQLDASNTVENADAL